MEKLIKTDTNHVMTKLDAFQGIFGRVSKIVSDQGPNPRGAIQKKMVKVKTLGKLAVYPSLPSYVVT